MVSQAEMNDAALAASSEIDRLVRVYIKIRDARAKEKRTWEAADKNLLEQQDLIKVALLQHMQTHGVSQIGTEEGTVYKTEKMNCSAEDWQVLYDHIELTGNFELLEKRISKTRVKEYMDENDGRLPPGVSVFREVDVNIRRK